MTKRWRSAALVPVMLLTLAPALPRAAAAEQLPQPDVVWLSEDTEIGGMTYKAGKIILQNIPTDIMPNYHVEITNTETGQIYEEYDDGFGGGQTSTQEIWLGWYPEEPMPAGTYTATVYYRGDGGATYTDSEPATTQPYTYTPPGDTYAAPTGVRWDGSNLAYTLDERALTEGTTLFVQFRKEPEQAGGSYSTRYRGDSTSHAIETNNQQFLERLNEFVTDNGAGNYAFRIRVISWDITKTAHSSWSEWSEYRAISGTAGEPGDRLDEILEALPEQATDADKQAAMQAVQDMDQKALRESLSADQDGTGVAAQLAALEKALGVGASVTVEPDAGLDLAADQVTVVGAGLSAKDVNDPPTLTISKVDETLEIPNTYRDYVQMELSLGDKVDTNTDGTLKVPIQITMPVPAGLDPNRLHILHFHQDGTRELIHPHLFQDKAGQYMARFTVNQLSPFVFAQYQPITVTFDPAGGTVEPASQQVGEDGKLTGLPTPVWEGHSFQGWFTADGRKVTADEVYTADTTLCARWEEETTPEVTPTPTPVTPPSGGGGGGGSANPQPKPADPVTEGGTTTVTTTLKPPLSGSAAQGEMSKALLKQAVESVLKAAEQAGADPAVEVVLDTPAKAEGFRLTLAAEPLEQLAGAEGAKLSVTSPVGSLTLDAAALQAVAGQSSGELTFTILPVAPDGLNRQQQLAAQSDPVFHVSIRSDGAERSDLGGGAAVVTVPYVLAAGQDPQAVVVSFLDDAGALTDCPTTCQPEEDTVTFTTPHLSLYVVRCDPLSLWVNPFADVAEDAWYYEAVRYVSGSGLMNGYSGNRFGPEDVLSRGQLTQLLYNLAGRPDLSNENLGYPFADVPGDAWYADSVYWARLNGVVQGYSGETFGPEDPITREQLVTMLYRYLQSQGEAVSGGGDLSAYRDEGAVSGYARDAMEWACAGGLIQGTNGALNPQAAASRAEVAQLLHNLLEQ